METWRFFFNIKTSSCSYKYLVLYGFRAQGIFSIRLIENVDQTVPSVFFLVKNIEWCYSKVIVIHSFIYEKVLFNSFLTAVCSELWMAQVELDWCINSLFMINDFGAVIHRTYWVWQLLIWGNCHHWLEWNCTKLYTGLWFWSSHWKAPSLIPLKSNGDGLLKRDFAISKLSLPIKFLKQREVGSFL